MLIPEKSGSSGQFARSSLITLFFDRKQTLFSFNVEFDLLPGGAWATPTVFHAVSNAGGPGTRALMEKCHRFSVTFVTGNRIIYMLNLTSKYKGLV
jgi:hypothetical protein